jgi:hypothetical protein
LDLLLVKNQKVSYRCETTSKAFEYFHKSYTAAAAMATMTFHDGGCFGFKVI